MSTVTRETLVIGGVAFEGVTTDRRAGGIDFRRVLAELLHLGVDLSRPVKHLITDTTVECAYADGTSHALARWSCESFDPEALRVFVGAALRRAPVHAADQIIAALNDGKADVDDNPQANWVSVAAEGYKVAAIHRRLLIPTWPDDVD